MSDMCDELILVQDLIYEIRGEKVMLDFDLAKLYHIETKALKQAVRRNLGRFPGDFMFTLSKDEYNLLITSIRSQFVTLEDSRGKYPKYAPMAFTELGVAMLSSVLKSDVAIAANIAIMRAFVQVRKALQTTSTISTELKELRAKVDLLAVQQENDLGALNDLSEDVRQDIDNLYLAIADLAVRLEEKKNEPRTKIGFKEALQGDSEASMQPLKTSAAFQICFSKPISEVIFLPIFFSCLVLRLQKYFFFASNPATASFSATRFPIRSGMTTYSEWFFLYLRRITNHIT